MTMYTYKKNDKASYCDKEDWSLLVVAPLGLAAILGAMYLDAVNRNGPLSEYKHKTELTTCDIPVRQVEATGQGERLRGIRLVFQECQNGVIVVKAKDSLGSSLRFNREAGIFRYDQEVLGPSGQFCWRAPIGGRRFCGALHPSSVNQMDVLDEALSALNPDPSGL